MANRLDKAGLSYLWNKIKNVFVKKTGDTLTGDIVENGGKYNYKIQASSGDFWEDVVRIKEKNSDNLVGKFEVAQESGIIKVNIGSQIPNDGDYLYNQLQLGFNAATKERFIKVSDGELWRNALNVPPANHASTATTYGLGTTVNYGHVKTVNNLTTSAHDDGLALSAYQGKVLNDKIKLNQQWAAFDAKSIASATNTSLGSISLAAGNWIIIGKAAIAASGVTSINNQRFAIGLFNSTTAITSWSTNSRMSSVSVPYGNAITTAVFVDYVNHGTTTTYYLGALQNSGSTKSVSSAALRAIKVG